MFETALGMGNGKGIYGEQVYYTFGTFPFIVPKKVTELSAVSVAGGNYGAGVRSTVAANRTGMGGAGLSFRNSIPVIPGETLYVVVGKGSTARGTPGEDSYIYRLLDDGESIEVLCIAKASTGFAGGKGGKEASELNDGGGTGGNGGSGESTSSTGNGGGAGGAGGYTGKGGNGTPGIYALNVSEPVKPTTGGGYGGKGGGGSSGQKGTTPSGGVFLYGYYPDFLSNRDGSYPPVAERPSGLTAVGRERGAGGVRLIWGKNRAFPSTNAHYMK